MKIKSRRLFGLLLVSIMGGALMSGCAEIRKVTYPPDFKYIEKTEVRSTMAQLASRIWEMDEILVDPEQALLKRDRVVALLSEMESFAGTLDPQGRPTNHLLIDEHIGGFIDAVSLARTAVEMEPPSFYRAGQLSGNCMGCHIHRQ